MQTMVQALLCVLGFCYAPTMYLPPVQFANIYAGEYNKGLIVSLLDCTGFLRTTVCNLVLSSLVPLVGWRGTLACNASMFVLDSLVMGYLQW